jgi:hypothetical protein
MAYKDKEKQKEYYKKYFQLNKEKKKEYLREYRNLNKEKTKEYRNLNKKKLSEKAKEYKKKYFQLNKEKLVEKSNEYRNNRRKIDNLFKLKQNITSSISKSFRNNGYTKKSRTYQILGCSFNTFKLYIENQFQPWMNWDNYGKYKIDTFNYGWDLDHIIPTSSATTEAELIKSPTPPPVIFLLQPVIIYINDFLFIIVYRLPSPAFGFGVFGVCASCVYCHPRAPLA